MKRIIIDTNIYVALKRNIQSVVEVLMKVEYIGINTIVLGELHSGFKGGSKENLSELPPSKLGGFFSRTSSAYRLRDLFAL